MCASTTPLWANQELQQEEVAVVGLQARVISPGPLGEWAQGTWPGCHEGTPANISHLLPQASTVRLLAVPAHHPGLGDNPTRGLGSQPLKHMSMSGGEKSLAQALGSEPVNQEALHRREQVKQGHEAVRSGLPTTGRGRQTVITAVAPRCSGVRARHTGP